MKITIYELLGLIKDDKAPEKVKYQDKIYSLTNALHYKYKYIRDGVYLLKDIGANLNEIVEILEEEKKIPEKLEGIDSLFEIGQDLDLKGFLAWQKANNKMVENKINSIIDYLKSKGEE